MVKKVLLNFSRYFFLILFLGFFASVTFFNHTHTIEGYTIVHSHPFKKSPSGLPMHNHDANGFLLIHFLAVFTAVVIAALFMAKLFLLLLNRSGISHSADLFFQYYLNPNYLRGPPQV
jgi:hypothetical protein